MCPQTAPMRPNGIALTMMSGCTYDRSGTASSAKIISSASTNPRCSPPTAYPLFRGYRHDSCGNTR